MILIGVNELSKSYITDEILSNVTFGFVIVNFITYFIAARVIGIEEVASSGISWFCAVLFAYITNKIFVFESKTETKKETIKEMISFFLARIVSGALCDVGTFALMVKVLNIIMLLMQALY